MSEFVSDIDHGPGGPILPSGVHLDMPDFADIDNVSQVFEFVSFGEPGSGTISPESGNVMAMSDFVGNIDAEPGEPFLSSGVHVDMPDFADIDILPSRVHLDMPDYADVDNVPDSESRNVMAMSDVAGEVDAEPGEPFQPSGVHLDLTDFADVDNMSQVPDGVSLGEPGFGMVSPESGNVMAMSDFAGDIDAEPGEPFLPSGVHLDMPYFADIDNVSQAPE